MSLLHGNFGNNADREVDINQVADAMAADTHTVLDVREKDEWDEVHIDGTIHIPMTELDARVNELSAEKPLYVLCHSGARSLYVLDMLEQAGHTGPKSMAGGIVAWAQSGRPITR